MQGFTTPQVLDTDGTLAANSDYIAPSEKAVKTYIDAHDLSAADLAETAAWANGGTGTHTASDAHIASTANPHSTTAAQVAAIPNDGWIADATGWSVRSQAYTNDPAAGQFIVLNMTDTSKFAIGYGVIVSSSAGSEMAIVTALVANTSITVTYLALNHTTTTPVVTAFAFTTAADESANIKKGDLVKFTQTTVKYLVVSLVTSTVITFIPTSDYLITAVAISATSYSHLHNPIGAPNYFASVPWVLGLTTPVVTAGGLKAGFSNLGGGVISYSARIGLTSWAAQTSFIIFYFVTPTTWRDYRSWGLATYYRTGTSTQQGTTACQFLDAYTFTLVDKAAANPIPWEASAAVVLTFQIIYDI